LAKITLGTAVIIGVIALAVIVFASGWTPSNVGTQVVTHEVSFSNRVTQTSFVTSNGQTYSYTYTTLTTGTTPITTTGTGASSTFTTTAITTAITTSTGVTSYFTTTSGTVFQTTSQVVTTQTTVQTTTSTHMEAGGGGADIEPPPRGDQYQASWLPGVPNENTSLAVLVVVAILGLYFYAQKKH